MNGKVVFSLDGATLVDRVTLVVHVSVLLSSFAAAPGEDFLSTAPSETRLQCDRSNLQ